LDGSLIPEMPDRPRPYVVVIGNEKGGTGKSTTAMHLIVALMRMGYRVGSIDLDARQSSLTRFVENRRANAESSGQSLLMPDHRRVARAVNKNKAEAEAAELASLRQAFEELMHCAFIVIDTPGSDTYVSQLAHENADTLITPLNDSFVDIDMIARIDRARREVLAPSPYSKMVWENNNRRVMAGRPPLDWIVLRNRLAHIDPPNKRESPGPMGQLAQRIGFRLAPGFGERVIFRELFLRGLTVLDIGGEDPDLPPNPSHESARQEVQGLLDAIGLMQPAHA